MYHSVSGEGSSAQTPSCLALLGMTVSKKRFEEQLGYVSRNYTVIGMEKLIRYLKNGGPMPVNPLVITFDDGFRDNSVVAYPLLKKRGMKATFFIPGDPVKTGETVWLHMLYGLVDKQTEREIQHAGAYPDRQYVCQKKQAMTLRMKKAVEGCSAAAKKEYVRGFAKEHEIELREVKTDIPYMSAQEIEELCTAGHTIGAHSMTHVRLSELPRDQKEMEIRESKDMVHKICEQQFIPFAYPFGDTGSFDETDKALLKENDFACAVTTSEGLNGRATDVYELRRVEIGDFGRIDFAVHLSGIVGDLKMLAKKTVKKAGGLRSNP